jgi:hypothetical protein
LNYAVGDEWNGDPEKSPAAYNAEQGRSVLAGFGNFGTVM